MDKNTDINDLIPDDRNANRHSEEGMKLLQEGLQRNGFGRSILISADDKIIAGNGVVQGAKITGLKNVKIVDTDGKEVIAVRRKDIKSGTKEFYDMALSDNGIAKKNIIMDAEVVDAICEEYELEPETLGVDEPVELEKEEKTENNLGIYPLSVVLNAREYKDFQLFKKENGFKTDTQAFKNLFENKLLAK